MDDGIDVGCLDRVGREQAGRWLKVVMVVDLSIRNRGRKQAGK